MGGRPSHSNPVETSTDRSASASYKQEVYFGNRKNLRAVAVVSFAN